jgi:protein CLEC16A
MMFRKIGEALGLSPTVGRFTVAYLKHLHAVLEKNPLVTPQNVDMMVETVREISELVTWGDRHDNTMSEFFMERRMLERLLSYLEPARRTAKPVKVQILQTLSIFFTNLTNNTLVFYLLSNDRVNELITHRFDFHDEELMAYYISFLKALSLRVNADTVHFFFNPQKVPEFPLLTEALKFYNHDDHMVRIAVRTLTLNVYKVDDPGMRRYVANKTAVPYFSNIVWELMRRFREMDSIVVQAAVTSSPRELLPVKR